MIVPTFNWTDFFIPHLKIPSIKKYHHFRVTSSEPGCVFVREYCDSSEVKLDLLKAPWSPSHEELSPAVPPKGLSAKRQWYLHKQISPFCPESDTVCPLPTVPKPGSRAATPHPDRLEIDGTPPPSKCRWVSGICKEGHDRCSCPNKN